MSPNLPYQVLLEKELEIAGIRTGIVNQHDKIIPFWAHHLQREPTEDNPNHFRKAHLLHVDQHDDMKADVKHLDQLTTDPEGLLQFVIEHTHSGNFLFLADFLKMLGSIYWYKPEERTNVDVFRDERGYGWRSSSNRYHNAVWRLAGNECDKTPLTIAHYKKDMWGEMIPNDKDQGTDFILDIDLDAFLCIGTYPHEDKTYAAYQKRLADTRELLTQVPRRPDLISIARSCSPIFPYVPADKVELIQRDVVTMLGELYG